MYTRTLATIALIALAACSHGNANSTSDNSANATGTDTSSPAAIDTQASPQSATIQTDKGAVTIGNAVDTSKMGAPAYPGATTDNSHSVSISGGGTSGSSLATFQTTDGFDKVYAFYKQQLPADSEKFKMSAGGVSSASFQFPASDGLITTVSISTKDSVTNITMTHTPK
jgi:hypothetical protein